MGWVIGERNEPINLLAIKERPLLLLLLLLHRGGRRWEEQKRARITWPSLSRTKRASVQWQQPATAGQAASRRPGRGGGNGRRLAHYRAPRVPVVPRLRGKSGAMGVRVRTIHGMGVLVCLTRRAIHGQSGVEAGGASVGPPKAGRGSPALAFRPPPPPCKAARGKKKRATYSRNHTHIHFLNVHMRASSARPTRKRSEADRQGRVASRASAAGAPPRQVYMAPLTQIDFGPMTTGGVSHRGAICSAHMTKRTYMVEHTARDGGRRGTNEGHTPEVSQPWQGFPRTPPPTTSWEARGPKESGTDGGG